MEIPRGMGVSITPIFKRNYETKLKIPGGGGSKPKNHPWGEVLIFSGTTPCGTKPVLQNKQNLWPVLIINDVNSLLFHYFYMFVLKQNVFVMNPRMVLKLTCN